MLCPQQRCRLSCLSEQPQTLDLDRTAPRLHNASQDWVWNTVCSRVTGRVYDRAGWRVFQSEIDPVRNTRSGNFRQGTSAGQKAFRSLKVGLDQSPMPLDTATKHSHLKGHRHVCRTDHSSDSSSRLYAAIGTGPSRPSRRSRS